jgi:hypothetical protein
MDTRMQTALVPRDMPNRLFPYPNGQDQGPSDDAANANSTQDLHVAQPNGRKVRKPRTKGRGNKQDQGPSDDASNANLTQDLHVAQPNGQKKRKPRTKKGNKTLHQMIEALATSTPHDNHKKQAATVQPADDVQKKKGRARLGRKAKQHNVEQLTAALEDASLTQQEGDPGQPKGTVSTTSGMYDDLLIVHGKQEGTKRITRSMKREPPLGFDSSYLKKVGDAPNFMNNDEIKTWISSVSHLLKSWYRKHVCNPANEAHLRAAQSDPEQFVIAVSRHESKPPRSVRLAGEPEGEVSDLVLRTWKVAGHIAREGQRGGAFASWNKWLRIRYAAIMLLVTVIMDLTVNMGYFVRLFLGVHADLTAEDERILLALGSAPASPAEPTGHRSLGAVPRTLQVPADLFGSVRKTFEILPKSTGCRILVHPPSGPGLARYIVLIGSATQMDEAEDVITIAMDTSATPYDMDLP